tara:strand:+ start:315 stop:1901 length:1587 start_codon:yes stop_codon:yes gene_type:complete
MANRDIAGLLTGISSTQRPNPNMNSDQWRMAFGAQQGQNLSNAVGTPSPEQAIQMGMAKLDLTSIKGLTTLAEMQQLRGDTAGAAKTASMLQGMRNKQQGIEKASSQRTGFAAYLENTYPNKGYGELALQGLITPANMKNFIKEADSDRKTKTITISVGGVNKVALIDEGSGDILKTYEGQIKGDADINAPDYFTKEVVRNGVESQVMFKRIGDAVTEVKTLGASTPALDNTSYNKIEITKDDGQKYVQFLDLNKPEGERLVHEAKVDENRESLEEVDSITGQTIKYTVLPDGTEKIRFGIVKPAKFDIRSNADGTFNVYNETLGRIENESVVTRESASQLIANKEKTHDTLKDIDRQIGFINEAKNLLGGLPDAIFHPLMRFVPSSDAKYLEVLTENLKSRIGVQELMSLREGSAVGATGLGALNLKELEMLQTALGRLDPTVGDKRFREQLDLVKKHYQGFRSSLMGVPSEIDWKNPAYSEFTRTVTDASGKPQTFYTLSDATGVPLKGSDGKIQWFQAIIPNKKD